MKLTIETFNKNIAASNLYTKTTQIQPCFKKGQCSDRLNNRRTPKSPPPHQRYEWALHLSISIPKLVQKRGIEQFLKNKLQRFAKRQLSRLRARGGAQLLNRVFARRAGVFLTRPTKADKPYHIQRFAPHDIDREPIDFKNREAERGRAKRRKEVEIYKSPTVNKFYTFGAQGVESSSVTLPKQEAGATKIQTIPSPEAVELNARPPVLISSLK